MKYENLTKPINVGTHIYRNRIVAAPIYCGTFVNIPPLKKMLCHEMGERAKGGFAQVTIGETAVDFDHASREPFPPIDYHDPNDPAKAALKEIADEIKLHGGKAMIELSHCGESMLKLPGLPDPIGPTGFIREDGTSVIEMNESMMEMVTDHFITAARFMKDAGFDGVLIHAGHGWLLHQFLSARTNLRKDEFGGSLESRAKFPVDLIRSVRNALGKDFIIEIRVSGDERAEGGMGVEETAAFCKMIEPYADLIHVSVGLYRDPVLSGQFSSMYQPHGLNADMAAVIKKAVNIPVAVVGGITSPDLAESLIEDGKCDMVALARPATAEPNFAKKVVGDDGNDVTQCIRCYKCFPGPLEDNLDDLDSLFGCSVNPNAFFYDTELVNSQIDSSKSVLVIGGGVGGMEAAIVAHDRGHKVTILEKSDSLGGLLNFADNDQYKTDLRKFKDLLISRVEKRGIGVKLGVEFTVERLKEHNPQAVIIAIGSSPIIPPIPGIDKAMHALDAYSDTSKVKKHVVIVGGGLVGCETGLNLAKLGRNVTIIEMQDKVAPDSYVMHRIALLHEMDEMLEYRTELKCLEILDNGIKARDREGNEGFIAADSVVYALGMKGRTKEAEEMERSLQGIDTYVVGDCVKAAKVYDV